MENWETLITFTYPQEAHQVQAYLNSFGIETMITDELTAQVHNFYSTAIGGVKIKVKEADIDEGLRLLKSGGYIQDKESDNVVVETIYYSTSPNRKECPFCHSKHIARRNDPNPLVVVVFFLLGFLFPLFRRSYLCYDCYKSWKFQRARV